MISSPVYWRTIWNMLEDWRPWTKGCNETRREIKIQRSSLNFNSKKALPNRPRDSGMSIENPKINRIRRPLHDLLVELIAVFARSISQGRGHYRDTWPIPTFMSHKHYLVISVAEATNRETAWLATKVSIMQRRKERTLKDRWKSHTKMEKSLL